MINNRRDESPIPSTDGRQLSATAGRILTLLRGYESPVDVDELAAQLGKHTNTVREHLSVLTHVGLVDREPAKQQRQGRPSWYYWATASSLTGSSESPSGSSRPVSIRDVRGSKQRQAADYDRQQDVASALTSSRNSDDDRALCVYSLLEELGFNPQLDRDRLDTIRLHACPLSEPNSPIPPSACSRQADVVDSIVGYLGLDREAVELSCTGDTVTCELTLTQQSQQSPAGTRQSAETATTR